MLASNAKTQRWRNVPYHQILLDAVRKLVEQTSGYYAQVNFINIEPSVVHQLTARPPSNARPVLLVDAVLYFR